MDFYTRHCFHKELINRKFIRPDVTQEEWFREYDKYVEYSKSFLSGNCNQYYSEKQWIEEGRPYYLVYPNIIPMLTKLPLDKINADAIEVPERKSLLLRMPKKNNPFVPVHEGVEYPLRSVLIWFTQVQGLHGLSIWLDFNEDLEGAPNTVLPVSLWSDELWHAACGHLSPLLYNRKSNPRAIYSNMVLVRDYFHTCIYRSFPLIPNVSIARICGDLGYEKGPGLQLSGEILDDITRMAVTVLMIDQGDTDLLEPDLLREDEAKVKNRELSPEERQRYIDRAKKRRGDFGWHLGRQYHEEYARVAPGTPYVTPPHLCHFHVGKGRSRVIVKMRKGWVANRKAVEQVPTGYESNESTSSGEEPRELSTGN